jgi:predicted nucleotidyltransferase
MTGPLVLNHDALVALCQRHDVRRLALFGSAITEGFDEETSDVDFLVEFNDSVRDRFDAYFGLKEDLEVLVGRPVDLVAQAAIENPYFAARVAKTSQELYAA